MCIIYTCRYKCDCKAPDVNQKPIHCSAFFQNKPCTEAQKVSYLSIDCGSGCTGWQDSATDYKEEYRREISDNHLYYGNKDVSQEDIFFETGDLSPKRPPFLLPSYQTANPARLKAPSSLKDRFVEDERPSSPTSPAAHFTPKSPDTPNSEGSVYSSGSPRGPATPTSVTSATSTVKSVQIEETREDKKEERAWERICESVNPAEQKDIKKRREFKGKQYERK